MTWHSYYDNSDGDWADANWPTKTGGAPADVPVDGDDIIIPGTTALAISDDTNLDQKGIKLGIMRIAEGMRFDIGTAAYPLIIDAAEVIHQGTGCLYFESNDNASTEFTDLVTIDSPGGSDTIAHLDGEQIDKIHVLRGKVTLAATLGSVTLPSRLRIGDKTSQHKAHVTLNGSMLASTGHITQFSGEFFATKDGAGSATIPKFTLTGGRATFSDGYVTEMEIGGGGRRGEVFWNVSNADGDLIASAFLYPGAVLDLTESELPKTITNLYHWPGSYLYRHEHLTTITNNYPQGKGGLIAGAGASGGGGQAF